MGGEISPRNQGEIVMARQRKVTSAGKVGQSDPVDIGEIGQGDAIAPVSDGDFVKDMELEAFMHQKLLIMVHASQAEGDLEIIVPNCCGKNQPIVREREQLVRRKYVEALARTRTTTYDQRVQNPAEPANIQMIPRSVLTYPFVVLNDPHPNGREWLKAILDER